MGAKAFHPYHSSQKMLQPKVINGRRALISFTVAPKESTARLRSYSLRWLNGSSVRRRSGRPRSPGSTTTTTFTRGGSTRFNPRSLRCLKSQRRSQMLETCCAGRHLSTPTLVMCHSIGCSAFSMIAWLPWASLPYRTTARNWAEDSRTVKRRLPVPLSNSLEPIRRTPTTWTETRWCRVAMLYLTTRKR